MNGAQIGALAQRHKIWIGVAALGAILGSSFLMMGPKASTPKPLLETETRSLGVGALGRVEPATRIRRLNHSGGATSPRVAAILVEEGDQVKQGQIVAEFADAALKEAAVQQAVAALAEAQANLARIRAAGRPSEIRAQRSRIAALTADLDLAEREADRAERLLPTGAGTAVAADRGRANAARFKAERDQAEADLESLISARPEDVAAAEARVVAAEAALARARSESALARVSAPIDGTVLRIYARPGELLGPDGLMEIADLTNLDVVADVYETDLPRIRPNATAEIIIPGEKKRYEATVRDIGWTVRRQTQASPDPVAAVDSRTVEVRLALKPDAVEQLRRRTNMQVKVVINP